MSKEYLPGSPSAALIRKVKRHLWSYGIRPKPAYWRLAWGVGLVRRPQLPDRRHGSAVSTSC